MSENWTMPAWMREVIDLPVDSDVIGKYEDAYNENKSRRTTSQRMLYDEIVLLEELRAAGLLLTPREKRGRDITMSELGVAIRGDATLITRLRAENERLRDALAKIGEWLLIHDLTIVDKMKQVTAALGAEHE